MSELQFEYRVAPAERAPLGDDGITVRRPPAEVFTDAELEAIAGLMRRAYNNDPGLAPPGVDLVDHLRWKSRDFPGPTYRWVLELGERIIYTDLEQFRRYRIGTSEHWVRGGGDIAMEPEFQGQRLAARVRDFRTVTLDPRNELSYGVESHPTDASFHRRSGSMRPFGNALQVRFRPIDIGRLYRTAPRQGGGSSRTREVLEGEGRRVPGPAPLRRFAWRAVLPLWRLRYRPPRRRFEGTIDTVVRFDDEITPFLDAATKPFAFVHVRTPEWLNWRLCDPRGGDFRVRFARDRYGSLVGYSATRVRDGSLWIADLLVLPERLEVLTALLDDAAAHAREVDAAGVYVWTMAVHPYNDLLRRHGFVTRRPPGILTYGRRKIDASKIAFLAHPRSRVHVALQDQDLI